MSNRTLDLGKIYVESKDKFMSIAEFKDYMKEEQGLDLDGGEPDQKLKPEVEIKGTITKEELHNRVSEYDGEEVTLFASEDGRKKLSVIYGGSQDGRYHCIIGDRQCWNYTPENVIEAYNNF